MKPGVKVTLDKVASVLKTIRDFETTHVMVGIPAENAGRKDGPMTNADLGYIHDRGAPEANIPARPFLSEGIEHAQPQIAKELGDAAAAALDGNAAGMQKGYTRAGEAAVASVREMFTDNSWPKLKRPRPKKGRSHRKGAEIEEKPLIDTGQLRKSITHVTRKVK